MEKVPSGRCSVTSQTALVRGMQTPRASTPRPQDALCLGPQEPADPGALGRHVPLFPPLAAASGRLMFLILCISPHVWSYIRLTFIC